jgi:DNA-binding GntR family transcriptional regulator
MADIRFHGVFIERSGNHHLVTILRDLKIKFRRAEVTYFEGYAYAKHSLDEHARIMEALGSKDVPLAQSLIRANWQSSLKRLKEIECRAGIEDTNT